MHRSLFTFFAFIIILLSAGCASNDHNDAATNPSLDQWRYDAVNNPHKKQQIENDLTMQSILNEIEAQRVKETHEYNLLHRNRHTTNDVKVRQLYQGETSIDNPANNKQDAPPPAPPEGASQAEMDAYYAKLRALLGSQ